MARNYGMSNNKFMPKKRKNDNTIVAKIWVSDDTSDNVYNEILDVLSNAQFTKLSYPIGAYRKMLDDSLPDDDNRVIGIGYVKKFDPKSGEFVIHVYNNQKDIIKSFSNPLIEVVFNTYNDQLKTITKLNIVPGMEIDGDDDEEEYSESAQDAEAYTVEEEESILEVESGNN